MDFKVIGEVTVLVTVQIPALEQLLPHLAAFMDSAATPAPASATPRSHACTRFLVPGRTRYACTHGARLHGTCGTPRYAGSHSPCCGPHDSAYLHHGPDCKGGC